MQSSGIVRFVETAARHRVALYRERATELRRMAQAEPIGPLRTRLIGLAREYEELAEGPGAQNTSGVRARSRRPHRIGNRRNRE